MRVGHSLEHSCNNKILLKHVRGGRVLYYVKCMGFMFRKCWSESHLIVSRKPTIERKFCSEGVSTAMERLAGRGWLW